MSSLSPIPLHSLASVGRGLRRPECVLCTSDGSIVVSNWDGGVTVIEASAAQHDIVAEDSPVDLKPNGLALLEDGSFLLANLGDDGGVWRLYRDGGVEPFLTSVDGIALPPSNFVLVDAAGRTWLTVSTRISPRADAYRPDTADGFIALVDASGSRIVADGLGYTNEVQVHPSGQWLYVNETFARRTSRMRIATDGSLGPRQTVTEYGPGTFPDGLCFDEQGAFWVVSIVSNRVIRVTPDGSQTLLVEDADPQHVAEVEAAFTSGTMGRRHLDRIQSERLQSTSSIAFGGPDRRNCLIGCLLGDSIASFRSPVAGVKPVHWNWRAA
ncbi:MAG: SMP-30/gluconolactonase/LRE family protein [Woeseiaceae bacterium]|nr:SMP-30/gluconolactonase/LRE family protein [Woeseiaceae bacterium]